MKTGRETVFVYGALRRGASNAWRMNRADYLGPATVRGTLVKVDWYPGLLLTGETEIHGEVYEVDGETLAELDEFEGIGSNEEYQRVWARVQLASGREIDCQLYEWQLGQEDYEVVANGDWLSVEQ
ncbi:gamma-glutamylcyclotransferase family protein [Roseibacillus ishigakijimensis]|uniref:Gamma-glutamylcyclotransferase family protein n=1 Tax=Roseibacillus ishigakijimensis TaxID=454146 RepID=A0A934RU91_9BACT|nr:gamma-glutamylcyclotransferase family protein [Roseibacillus ishigakijimensis]MBK1835528.1 gamma-glutamylcyclotransferase [Roseibacillus ishigakijimensis]